MSTRPNILLVTTDHLRHDTLGFAGDPVIKTPAIDALAQESVNFSNWFVQSPVCHPSRASLMTGRYPCHHGVRWNFNALSENEVTLVQHLKERGYSTACVGKYHLDQDAFENHLDHKEAEGIRNMDPQNPFVRYVADRGFEYRTGFALPEFVERLGAVVQPDQPEDCHLDAFVGMKACEYLKGLPEEEPFFLWVGFYGPHHPYVPSGKFASMYDPQSLPPFHRSAEDIRRKPKEYSLYMQAENHKFHPFTEASEQTFREMKAAYYGMVSQLDWQLGVILDTLEERGLADDTIVVFTSDHGEFLGDHSIPCKAPFLLDCMLHVPCLVRARKSAPGGTRVDDLTESVDLFPTLCGLSGIEAPEFVQGRDLSSLVLGGSGDPGRTAVYAEAVDKRCLRTREWKLIHYAGKPYGELYNLIEDPFELENLYAERGDIVERMTLAYYRHLDAIEDTRHPTYARFSGTDSATGSEVTHYITW